MDKPNEWVRVSRFATVGVFNTALDMGLFSLLFYVHEVSLLSSNSIGYLVAVTNSFFFNKYWTFSDTHSHGKTHRQFIMFTALGAGGLLLSNGVVWLMAEFTPEIIAKGISVGVLFVWNYMISRKIVFIAHPTSD